MDHHPEQLLATTTTIVVAAMHAARASDIPELIASTYAALAATATGAPPANEEATGVEHAPATTVRKSLANPDHIISMIDGKPYKTLRRHLSKHGLTPEEYRTRYGLKDDYPMTAPTYAAMRSEMATKNGLGRKPVDVSPSKG